MKYEIIGENMPAAVCELEAGQGVFCEAGAMAWMDPQIEMRTEGGTFGKMLGRLFSGDKLMRNHYIANEAGSITFSSNYPGQILAVELNGNSIIAQKGSFLASDETVDMDIFMQKKIAGGLFSGEGFILQKFSGQGTVLIEVDGTAYTYELKEGEQKIISSGYLVMMDETCELDIKMVEGAANILFGEQGLFVTTVTGPGRVTVQTMPMTKMVQDMMPFIKTETFTPTVSSGSKE